MAAAAWRDIPVAPWAGTPWAAGEAAVAGEHKSSAAAAAPAAPEAAAAPAAGVVAAEGRRG